MGFVGAARDAFQFLVQDFGNVGPLVRTGLGFTAPDYTGRGVGVTVEFEMRDQLIDVLLVPLSDGRWPPRDRTGWVFLTASLNVAGGRSPYRDRSGRI